VNSPTPGDTLEALVAARGRRDLKAALAYYEPTATVVLQPGKTASGIGAIRAFIEGTMELPIVFGDRVCIESGDLALHVSGWTVTLPDNAEHGERVTGRTADVLRRQSDGSWLIVIDNPWGAALLDE
jgi:ketosteroid isomerase-like protein